MSTLEIADALSKSGWNKRFTDWELLDLASDMLLKQQTEITRLQQLCESHIRSEYEGTSLLDGMLEDLYGKAQEK